ncbi:tRNA pseudouridine(65) synthase TruC [Agarivorans sp. Toyoura001]|uniref:tRNA pseudouridine(65) synthase TruC n=1 Tax=unclassified Agarivorans TaxID=2636026 RepID=UPI0010E1C298|nr:tRNA pseudouridine(65) synthase TruC [Agarivorans sp. Toyoura001]GDY25676.1 tRNA pseudouridine(65) synthase TruC [Agarivorans sp. Toyoura001]
MNNIIETAEDHIEPIPAELDILYQDEHYAAIYKPAGLLVHRSWIAKEATQFAMQMLRDQLGQYVYPVHRLDRPTSGVLIMAKSSDAAKHLSVLFAEHAIRKTYLAVVRGYIEGEHLLDYPLKEKLDKMVDGKAQQDKPAQSAITHYKGLQKSELPYPSGKFTTSRYSLVELKPETGRKHQLRRHMHHLSHHIIGDTTYGDGRHNRLFRDLNHAGLWLIANQLSFVHPYTKQNISIVCPRPERWKQMFKLMNWK